MTNNVGWCARHMGQSGAWRGWAALAAVSVAMAGAAPTVVHAQAANYASLQAPYAATRDYTAAVAGGGGTTFLFQWREGAGAGMHWQLDAALADPKGPQNPRLVLGGYLARELTTATPEQPLAMLLTGGIGGSFGDGSSVWRVPVGVSVGHTFDLDAGMALTPYAHPRVALDACARCGPGRKARTTASLNVDVGVEWKANDRFGMRAAATFSGSDVAGSDESVTVGLTWTPAMLSGGRRR
ncbi:MAG: hypothetical protein LCH84_15445 [Gemmatimonadetes bacterium]|nr:hypothetical protein [Gemmatimonadota bacterium]